MISINYFNIINVYEFKIKFYVNKVLELRFPHNESRKFKQMCPLVTIIPSLMNIQYSIAINLQLGFIYKYIGSE